MCRGLRVVLWNHLRQSFVLGDGVPRAIVGVLRKSDGTALNSTAEQRHRLNNGTLDVR